MEPLTIVILLAFVMTVFQWIFPKPKPKAQPQPKLTTEEKFTKALLDMLEERSKPKSKED
jgi:hypothetical protein